MLFMDGCDSECKGAVLGQSVSVLFLGNNASLTDDEILGVNPQVIVGRFYDGKLGYIEERYGIKVVNLENNGDFIVNIDGKGVKWD